MLYVFACLIHETLIPLDIFENHIKKHNLAHNSAIRTQILSYLLESHCITVDIYSPEPIGELMDVSIICHPMSCGWLCGKSSLSAYNTTC